MSVRFPCFRFLNRSREEQRRLQRANQGFSSGNVALQVSDNAGNLSNALNFTHGHVSAGDQRYSDHPIQVGQAGGAVEIQNGYRNGAQSNVLISNSNAAENRLNGLGLLFHTDSPSLKNRFRRACQAFVNAWRTA